MAGGLAAAAAALATRPFVDPPLARFALGGVAIVLVYGLVALPLRTLPTLVRRAAVP